MSTLTSPAADSLTIMSNESRPMSAGAGSGAPSTVVELNAYDVPVTMKDALQPRDIAPPITTPKTHIIFEVLAELLGTAVFVGFGTGANCQYAVGNGGQFMSFSTVPVGWGVGLALGNAFAARFSGGHLNPAVTLMLVLIGQVPAWKLPIYYITQVLGALAGAAITYGVYYHNIFVYDPGHTLERTAGLFGTLPAMDMPAFSCWLAEFFPSCVLIFTILYIVTLKPNPPFPVVPLALPKVLFLTILGVGCTFGSTTSFSMNPARDLGPRLLTWMAGYGKEVWNYKNQYWLWGGQLGAFSAAVFVSLGFHAFTWLERHLLDDRRGSTFLRIFNPLPQ
ncbi:aquaporin-like protein [Dacryopinax primogenitus]|uniref:Aquaporin-like protein n=1 Tax=Dacryopinax primogenitus (strain DJM 731) TaxID=1858805 RepID=M5G649_DACPD|nr:aquaporin-like protein [Dacryopinax primogenitus]EJU05731.1 aquaporin-like protein [Dacryopinax primogenitus]